VAPRTIDVEKAVRERYSRAAGDRAPELCCPINYDGKYLEIIPDEIVERDYGCGDPTRFVQPGETVLDLGSGGGKACYIAAQVVGASGQVIGVDMNDEMLDLAESHRAAIGDRLGYHNVRFCKGRIQDLALDYRELERRLAETPVNDPAALDELEHWRETARRERPMIETDSVDVIVSNCVLNLVRPEDKRSMFEEMHRVLRRGGRVVISDIVGDEDVPVAMQADPTLWSGCISGAWREDRFLEAFEDAGFYGVEIVARDEKPWQTVEGIEFRSVTVRAFKGKEGPCLDRRQAVVYRGPWRSVTDDDGHTLHRGRRMAVCDKTFRIYTSPPYAEHVEPVEPHVAVPLEDAPEFDCRRDAVRDPAETKGEGYKVTERADAPCCGPEGETC
jgi:SAM-dependent methyltransferase